MKIWMLLQQKKAVTLKKGLDLQPDSNDEILMKIEIERPKSTKQPNSGKGAKVAKLPNLKKA